MLLFVYGTLRKGMGNDLLLNNSKFLGYAETVEKYALYFAGIPFVIEEKVSTIKGELYEVDEETLRNIDALEGHPVVYKRKLVKVRCNGKIYDAWMYFFQGKITNGILIKNGDYVEFVKNKYESIYM